VKASRAGISPSHNTSAITLRLAGLGRTQSRTSVTLLEPALLDAFGRELGEAMWDGCSLLATGLVDIICPVQLRVGTAASQSRRSAPSAPPLDGIWQGFLLLQTRQRVLSMVVTDSHWATESPCPLGGNADRCVQLLKFLPRHGR
jgi:hypothetical protein